jgi:vancomycin resistance protein YoaR
MVRRIGLVAIIIILIASGVLFSLSGASYANKIVNGVHVGPVDLSGLSREQAMEKLSTLAESVKNRSIAIKHGKVKRQIQAGVLGVSLDIPKTFDKALLVGHTGSIIRRFRERQQVKRNGLQIEPVVLVNRAILERRIAGEFKEIIQEPVDAGFKITPDDRVEIVPGRVGRKVDFAALEREIARVVTGDEQVTAEVELPLLTVPPKRDTGDIEAMGINGLIARFSTSFDPGQVGRTYNVKVAAAALDGILVAPGEEFSFNRVVGPRSSEAGYKNAIVIVNNEFIEGIGGGVCQVSSTLYNAVLLANLKVTERSNHSLPVSYVPIGRDATVVYDALDFRFINNKESYIYIKSFVEGNNLTFKIYGNKETAPRVELASRVIEVIEPKVIYEKDPNLATGEQVVKQKGAKGYKVATTRTVWVNGAKVTEQLPVSYYQPVNRIIAVGTGAVKPSVVIPSHEQLDPAGTGDVPGDDGPAGGQTGEPEDEDEAGQQPGDGQAAGPGDGAAIQPADGNKINGTGNAGPGNELVPGTGDGKTVSGPGGGE